jgi:hypothetical protein
MKTLSVLGTAAMFLVGGGILAHGLPALHHGVQALTQPLPGWLGAVAGAGAGPDRRGGRGPGAGGGECGGPPARAPAH